MWEERAAPLLSLRTLVWGQPFVGPFAAQNPFLHPFVRFDANGVIEVSAIGWHLRSVADPEVASDGP